MQIEEGYCGRKGAVGKGKITRQKLSENMYIHIKMNPSTATPKLTYI